ncbi:agmatine deiminase family protein [Variovorax sp. ZS18.2.2]|uniref:agmatine deiminase family protein n=1 Tax=Variovorax sp. ZS18.2.2 TaxID=2971255 RepID=UPI002151AA0A|nr:agmatine deiminase family protein [Variovorax sp. ZS18.2.2]MCR6478184.1 agmatine deiminase family protein [Variovorax sp. ZS18.2.2]
MNFSPTRRRLLNGLGLAPLAWAADPVAAAPEAWHMPDEGDPHRATSMSFGPSEKIWGRRLLKPAREQLALIARTIAAFEPVHLLVREQEHDLAARLCGNRVQLEVQPVDDLWMRDTGPVFVRDAKGEWAGIDFNFNGWGGKQAHANDAEVAGYVTGAAKVRRLATRLVLEGGSIEVDGAGTAIVTESCVLNANRNPGLNKAACEAELGRLLGVRKIIWLPGIAGRDITDGHTDFYARFAAPGVVVAGLDEDPDSYDHAVTLRHLEILRRATDARGQRLRVEVLKAPETVRPTFETDEFAAGYINFYVCNGAVIAPQFGDAGADANARGLLRDLFPRREVVQLDIDAIAAGGGGIHCTTQQQPR